MHHAYALHGLDLCNRAIVFKTNHMADADFIYCHITITVSDGHHCLDFTGQGHGFVIAAATNRVLQRHVLGNAD